MPAKNTLDYLERVLDPVAKRTRGRHSILLLNPSLAQYRDTIAGLYRHLEYDPPTEILTAIPQRDVLNYTCIKPTAESASAIGPVEIYTICQDNYTNLRLLNPLRTCSADITVVVFIDIERNRLMETVNGHNYIERSDQNSLAVFKETCIRPILEETTTILNDTSLKFKSCIVCVTNASLLLYNSLTTSPVDYIQQFLRTKLLHHTTETGTFDYLVYFRNSISTTPTTPTQSTTSHPQSLFFNLLCGQQIDDSFNIQESSLHPDIFICAAKDSSSRIALLAE
ncbi:uncharacterized protein C5L36_0B01380 [Pichia kudriavzevii]|uniref:Uncharacterized protein n=1 Tax=Pichia kudriavzevii TaxID=4909 RepID=A0A2U9R0P6_PICKU|nr:uncharacterized protein C5L36_0B01380 [Pichia kudriavzevii]AWU74873.1 hypothetical protein C5L36_0B01380 [Pichia kudriavzevii]